MRRPTTNDPYSCRAKRTLPPQVRNLLLDYKREHDERLPLMDAARLLRLTTSMVNHTEVESFAKLFIGLEDDTTAREFARDVLQGFEDSRTSQDTQRSEITHKMNVFTESLQTVAWRARWAPNTKFTFGKKEK